MERELCKCGLPKKATGEELESLRAVMPRKIDIRLAYNRDQQARYAGARSVIYPHVEGSLPCNVLLEQKRAEEDGFVPVTHADRNDAWLKAAAHVQKIFPSFRIESRVRLILNTTDSENLHTLWVPRALQEAVEVYNTNWLDFEEKAIRALTEYSQEEVNAATTLRFFEKEA